MRTDNNRFGIMAARICFGFLFTVVLQLQRHVGHSEFLVYPGEHINVKGVNDALAFFAADGNRQRNRELLFLNKFQELRQQQQLQQEPSIPSFRPGVTLNTILTIEKQQKDRIRKSEDTYRHTFDSLIAASVLVKSLKS